MSSIGGVLKAYCGCLAGIDGRCNHVSATLFDLGEYCKEREKISKEIEKKLNLEEKEITKVEQKTRGQLEDNQRTSFGIITESVE